MFEFLTVSFFLGLGLAMDACAVSMANGFAEPQMKTRKIVLVAVMFGFFQGFMPLIGYEIGATIIDYIENFIPWIALVLLCVIGGKMIFEAIKEKNDEERKEENIKGLTFKALIVQAIATSIDALSVGLTIADYEIMRAVICALIIAVVTFIISFIAVFLGKKFGTKLGSKAEIIGGIILIIIGLEIFITGII